MRVADRHHNSPLNYADSHHDKRLKSPPIEVIPRSIISILFVLWIFNFEASSPVRSTIVMDINYGFRKLEKS